MTVQDATYITTKQVSDCKGSFLKYFVLKSELCVVKAGDQALISVNYSFSISRDVSISCPCKDTKMNVSSIDPQIQNCPHWISRSSNYDSPRNSFDLWLFSLVDRVESEPKLSAHRNIGNGKDSGSSDENIDELDEFLNDSDGKKRFTLHI